MMSFQLIPLNQLVASPANVRRTDRKADVDSLAASIHAHGLLQNLSVKPRGEKSFEVVAGARRHAALKLLAKDGRIARDFAVPCHLIDDDGASEASLAENVHRLAMNAMDESDAFAALAEQQLDINAIAARFGVTARHVEQRLALAKLSPKLKAAYRRGDLNLDAARAFTIEPDHAKQDAVLRALGKPILHAGQVRALLTQGAMNANDRIARFVGIEAYESAGGALTRDLFDPDTIFIADPALMTQLAEARLDAVRQDLAALGWGWVDAELAHGGLVGQSAQRIHPTRRPMTRGERKALAALDAKIEAIDVKLNDPDCEDDALWREQEELDAKRRDLIAATEEWDKELIAHAGVMVRLNHQGDLSFTYGIVAKADQAKLKRVLAARAPEGEAPAPQTQEEGDARPAQAKISKALARELTEARAVALRAAIAEAPDLALAIVVYASIQSALRNGRAQGVELMLASVAAADQSPFEAARGRLAAETPEDDDALLTWCLGQTRDQLLAALAVLTASALDLAHDAHTGHDRALQRFADRLAAAVDLDMRRFWSVDASFLARLSKSMLMEIAADALALASKTPKRREAQLKAWAKLKRDELARAVAKALTGSGWLPELLITPAAAGAVALTEAGEAAAAAIAAE